jgi:hypothetical protein
MFVIPLEHKSAADESFEQAFDLLESEGGFEPCALVICADYAVRLEPVLPDCDEQLPRAKKEFARRIRYVALAEHAEMVVFIAQALRSDRASPDAEVREMVAVQIETMAGVSFSARELNRNHQGEFIGLGELADQSFQTRARAELEGVFDRLLPSPEFMDDADAQAAAQKYLQACDYSIGPPVSAPGAFPGALH